MKWPIEIVEKIAKRKAILFLGAGISANALSSDGKKRPPTWEKFIQKVSDKISDKTIIEYVNNLIKEKDYLTVCEVLVNQLGTERFERIAREEFLTPKYQSHKIHENVLKLDTRIVITPNVDKIYEVYAQAETAGTILVKKYYDSDLVSKIKSEERIILKIHGTLDESSKMIFTRSQYTNARYENAAFYRLLEALSLNYTFIFLGCGFSDPDIQLVLENYSFVFPGSPAHYFVTPEDGINDEYKRIIKENRNLEIITYNARNNHQELHDALEELVFLVEEERTRIAEEMDW
ncbi:SIR2 family protein [Mediterraneibacter glycyrrhizinilyticus]|uniref:SIR2 family protein n=1 Tax=Mediterraneibacter glycyrrhizinilyticus TaxID=342942 RepID=UPI0006D10B87